MLPGTGEGVVLPNCSSVLSQPWPTLSCRLHYPHACHSLVPVTERTKAVGPSPLPWRRADGSAHFSSPSALALQQAGTTQC